MSKSPARARLGLLIEPEIFRIMKRRQFLQNIGLLGAGVLLNSSTLLKADENTIPSNSEMSDIFKGMSWEFFADNYLTQNNTIPGGRFSNMINMKLSCIRSCKDVRALTGWLQAVSVFVKEQGDKKALQEINKNIKLLEKINIKSIEDSIKRNSITNMVHFRLVRTTDLNYAESSLEIFVSRLRKMDEIRENVSKFWGKFRDKHKESVEVKKFDLYCPLNPKRYVSPLEEKWNTINTVIYRELGRNDRMRSFCGVGGYLLREASDPGSLKEYIEPGLKAVTKRYAFFETDEIFCFDLNLKVNAFNESPSDTKADECIAFLNQVLPKMHRNMDENYKDMVYLDKKFIRPVVNHMVQNHSGQKWRNEKWWSAYKKYNDYAIAYLNSLRHKVSSANLDVVSARSERISTQQQSAQPKRSGCKKGAFSSTHFPFPRPT